MVVRKLLSQQGNAMFMVVLAMSALAAGTFVIMKQTTEARKSVKGVAQKQAMELTERKLTAYLTDREICNENFSNQGLNINQYRDLSSLTRNNKPFLEVGKLYQNGAIKVISLGMEPKTANSFDLVFTYEKTNAQIGGKTIVKRFNTVAETNASDAIIDCHMDNGGEVTDAFQEVMEKVCNGPGVMPSAEPCKVLEFDLQRACSGTQAIRGYTYNSATGSLSVVCDDVVSGNTNCPFGLKATGNNGEFECFSLGDMVDSSEVQVNENSNCAIAYDSASGKIKLNCSAGAPCVASCGPPPTDPATVCQGVTQSYNNSCGSPTCSFTGTKDCSVAGNVYSCMPTGVWKPNPPLNPQTCALVSPACDDSSGLGFMPGSDICCASLPSANCAAGTEPTLPEDEEEEGGGCFLAGTEVPLFNGEQKRIEEVNKGDLLLGTSGEPVAVKSLISFLHRGPKYAINGGRYFVTGSHPFKTPLGWRAFNPKLAKKDNPDLDIDLLKVGDTILTENGTDIISRIDRRVFQEKVYNFQVSGSHEYIADGFQVHNKLDCSCLGMSGDSGNTCSQNPKQYQPTTDPCAGGKREICGPCN